MKIELKEITVKELTNGYKDNAEEGVIAFGGKLDVRPPYQREFIYKDKQRDAVIDTITKDFPLNVMYWAVRDTSARSASQTYEIIDGQQRTISLCQYISGDFSFKNLYFHNLKNDQQEKILNYKLMIYLCSGTDSERLEWFKTINIAGEKLTDQELRNAVYAGLWVSDAKRYFSKNGCVAYQLGGNYLNGSAIRQEYLETTIDWISKGHIEAYMSKHQHDTDAKALWKYFQDVIAWTKKIFTEYHKEMKGVEWGRLYETYKANSYNPKKILQHVNKLYEDSYVNNFKGVFEYILGGLQDTKLLEVRVFDGATKRSVYAKQTKEAEKKEISNCPLCAKGHDVNKNKIWELEEMDADHVTAWSKGGATDIKNCQMLCTTHNRAKGNK